MCQRLRPAGMEEDSTFADLRRFESMTAEELDKYRGEWVAVAGGEVVAHGKDPLRTVRQGSAAGKGVPYMRFFYASASDVPLFYAP